jgi:hypothetical protein
VTTRPDCRYDPPPPAPPTHPPPLAQAEGDFLESESDIEYSSSDDESEADDEEEESGAGSDSGEGGDSDDEEDELTEEELALLKKDLENITIEVREDTVERTQKTPPSRWEALASSLVRHEVSEGLTTPLRRRDSSHAHIASTLNAQLATPSPRVPYHTRWSSPATTSATRGAATLCAFTSCRFWRTAHNSTAGARGSANAWQFDSRACCGRYAPRDTSSCDWPIPDPRCLLFDVCCLLRAVCENACAAAVVAAGDQPRCTAVPQSREGSAVRVQGRRRAGDQGLGPRHRQDELRRARSAAHPGTSNSCP